MLDRFGISSSMYTQIRYVTEIEIRSRAHHSRPRPLILLLQDLVTLPVLNGYIDNPKPLFPVAH